MCARSNKKRLKGGELMDFEERILEATSKLPRDIALKVLMDVHQRITDWRTSGGKDDDSYIEQQVRYAENIARSYETKKD